MHDSLCNSADKNETNCKTYKGQSSDAIGMRASHRRSPGICLSIVGEPGTRLRQVRGDHERGRRRAQARPAQPLNRSIQEPRIAYLPRASCQPAKANNDRAFRTWYAFGPHLHIVKLTGKESWFPSVRREP